jgi:hypothetical protein
MLMSASFVLYCLYRRPRPPVFGESGWVTRSRQWQRLCTKRLCAATPHADDSSSMCPPGRLSSGRAVSVLVLVALMAATALVLSLSASRVRTNSEAEAVALAAEVRVAKHEANNALLEERTAAASAGSGNDFVVVPQPGLLRGGVQLAVAGAGAGAGVAAPQTHGPAMPQVGARKAPAATMSPTMTLDLGSVGVYHNLVDCTGRSLTAAMCSMRSFFPAAEERALGCEALLRDGLCDAGQYPTDSGRQSPDLNCSKFAFDNGACVNAPKDSARLAVGWVQGWGGGVRDEAAHRWQRVATNCNSHTHGRTRCAHTHATERGCQT